MPSWIRGLLPNSLVYVPLREYHVYFFQRSVTSFCYSIFLLHNVCFLYSVVSTQCCFMHIWLFSVQCFFFCTMCFLYSVVSVHYLLFAYLVVFDRIGLVSPVLMFQGSYVMFSHTLSNKISLFYLKKKRSIEPPINHRTPSKKPISTFAHLN